MKLVSFPQFLTADQNESNSLLAPKSRHKKKNMLNLFPNSQNLLIIKKVNIIYKSSPLIHQTSQNPEKTESTSIIGKKRNYNIFQEIQEIRSNKKIK